MSMHRTFNILCQIGACDTKAQFSRYWLGSSEGYFTSLEARKRLPNMMAMIGLAARLELLADRLMADPRYREHACLLDTLIDDLWDEMRARALAAAPKRRAGSNTCRA